MSQLESGDWVTRLSATLRQHESTRIRRRETLARYEIQGELGRGGMGVIYRARDPQLDRIVALKVLTPEADESAEARERFLREAQLAAQLNHPNIVPVFDTGEHEGQIFLAMPLIEGSTLDKASLDPREAARTLRDGARAVQHAHDKGIIHRDLKPGNFMIDHEGRLFVMDFGLARRREVGVSLTLSGMAIGTPAYMPPEQARGQAVDVRADVYSLGATLYEVLAGRPPFKGANAMAIMKAVTLDEPPPLRNQNAGVPQDLEAIVLKAMAKKPEQRYAGAADLADDLERFLKGEPVRAPSCGTFYRLRKRISRHRWRVLAATSLGALLLVLGVSGAALWNIVGAWNLERAQRGLEESKRRALLADAEKADEVRREGEKASRQDLEADFETRFRKLPSDFDALLEPRFLALRNAQERLATFAADEWQKQSKIPSWEPGLRWLKHARKLGHLRPDPDYLEGCAHVGLGQWSKALEIFEALPRAVKPHAGFAPLWVHEATQSKDPKVALKHLLRALELDSGLAGAHQELPTFRLLAGGTVQEALEDLERAREAGLKLQAPPLLIERVLQEAASLQKQGWPAVTRAERERFYSEAEQLLQRLLAGGPLTDERCLLEWVRMLCRLGQSQEALRLLPDMPSAQVLSARIQTVAALKAGDKTSLQKLLPSLSKLPLLRSRVLSALGHPEGALDALEGLPGPLARRDAADLLARRNQYPRAVTNASNVLEFTGLLEEEDYIAGLFEAGPLSPAQALDELKRDAHIIHSEAKYSLEDWDGCFKDAESALKLDPLAWKAHGLCGMALSRLGKYALALTSLEKALQGATGKDLIQLRDWKKRAEESLPKKP